MGKWRKVLFYKYFGRRAGQYGGGHNKFLGHRKGGVKKFLKHILLSVLVKRTKIKYKHIYLLCNLCIDLCYPKSKLKLLILIPKSVNEELFFFQILRCAINFNIFQTYQSLHKCLRKDFPNWTV